MDKGKNPLRGHGDSLLAPLFKAGEEIQWWRISSGQMVFFWKKRMNEMKRMNGMDGLQALQDVLCNLLGYIYIFTVHI